MAILSSLAMKNISMISGLSLSQGGKLYKIYLESNEGWFRRGQNTLKLKFTNASDAGNFECQVSTNPKISQIFTLNIIGIVKTPTQL